MMYSCIFMRFRNEVLLIPDRIAFDLIPTRAIRIMKKRRTLATLDKNRYILRMIHPNPMISAFIGIPEWAWKNHLRRWLAFSSWVPDAIQDYSPLKGYEMYRQLQPGDVVVDAGAFPGDYTLFAARQVGEEGQVYAFEPDGKNRAVLERNIRKSGFTNIQVIPMGLWNRETTLSLDSQGVASQVQQEGSCSIQVTRLDRFMEKQNVPRIDVIKMDIEGAELEALEGARQTLSQCQYTCIATYHLVGGQPTSKRVEARLEAAGLDTQTAYPKHTTTYGWRVP